MTERMRLWVQAAEMGFLCRVAGVSLRDREVFLARTVGRRPRGRPRTRERDYISSLAWECLGIPQSELADMAGEREVWG